MKILVSNDDGVHAFGLQALAQALATLGEVTVVAPESERSGSSSALTLDRPLYPHQLLNGYWSVNGTPADCVYLALNGLFEHEFDLLVTGINHGANLADDVLYSGTVGAAFEGRMMKQAPIAVSLVSDDYSVYNSLASFVPLANYVVSCIKKGLPVLPPRHIWNINAPYTTEPLSVHAYTRMGVRLKSWPVVDGQNPRGKKVFWIGRSGAVDINDEHKVLADFEAVAKGLVSITPLQMDATSFNVLDNIKLL